MREFLLLILSDTVTGLTRPLYFLHCKDLLPMWVVNLPCNAFPRSWMSASAAAHNRRWRKRQWEKTMRKGGAK